MAAQNKATRKLNITSIINYFTQQKIRHFRNLRQNSPNDGLKIPLSPGVVAHTSLSQYSVGRSFQVIVQPGLHSELQAIKDYMVRP